MIDSIGSRRNCLITSTLAAQRAGRNSASSRVSGSTAAANDRLSIPQKGVVVSGLSDKLNIESIFGFTPKTPGQVSIDEMEYYGRQFLEEFRIKLHAVFKEKGIGADGLVDLTCANDGSIVVANDNPDKAAMEKTFKDNPGLGNELKKIDNLLTMAKLGRETTKFHEAYAKDPQAAHSKYSYLSNIGTCQ